MTRVIGKKRIRFDAAIQYVIIHLRSKIKRIKNREKFNKNVRLTPPTLYYDIHSTLKSLPS